MLISQLNKKIKNLIKKYKLIKHIFFSSLFEKDLNFAGQLFDRGGKLKTYECIKDKFSLTNTVKFMLYRSSGVKS